MGMLHKDAFKGDELYKVWSVFVGGTEVNDYLVDQREAKDIALNWQLEGYDDVAMRNYFTEQFFVHNGKKWEEADGSV